MNKVLEKKALPMHIVKALLFSYIMTAVILLLLSFILYKTQMPSGAISVGVILAYVLSTFVGGFFIGKKVESKKFVWGIITGVLYFAVILIIALILNKDVFSSAGSVIMVFAMCALGGMTGGMIS